MEFHETITKSVFSEYDTHVFLILDNDLKKQINTRKKQTNDWANKQTKTME